VPIDRYETNLRAMVAKMKKTGATLVWATVTPLHPETPGWKAGDEDKYNEVALKVMKENGVLINDLNAESKRQGFPKQPDVHSVGDLSAKTTEAILAAIASREKNSKPLPRVLLIGDSITGSYQNKVIQNLDGKAYTCKNPANAGNTDFGLANIDAWLDLKSYLQNGEAYLGLISAVRNALDNPGHVYPDYKDQGIELAGLFWFQGLADAASPSKSAEYETHLANLIRDLRKDLKSPNLPVVVTALATNKHMNEQCQQVHDAQMAVADAAKYPGFSGNVKSVDSLKACKPKQQSVGGRDPYSGHAASYLEIGEAMGKAMLELMK